MKLGIMQPYPFPYIGYFELIARSDRWVVFDVVQYNRRSWMNRNRILHPAAGWQYFGFPVRQHPHGTPLTGIRLVDRNEAQRRLLAQLEHYRRHAPHYRFVVDLVNETFARSRDDSLVGLSIAGLQAAAERLALPFAPQRCSELDLALDGVAHAGQWALHISQALGASEYINPSGGRSLFRPEEWRAAGIRLSFSPMTAFRYACDPYAFEANLSILDVLMWCAAADVSRHLRNLPPVSDVDDE